MEDSSIVRLNAFFFIKSKGQKNKTKNTMNFSNTHNIVLVEAFTFLEGTIK